VKETREIVVGEEVLNLKSAVAPEE